jgi:uncharacterized membrane protein YdjX (TVP38/TMEM64 family)
VADPAPFAHAPEAAHAGSVPPAPRLDSRLLLIKALLLVALAMGGVFLARLPGFREWLGPEGRLSDGLKRLGWIAAPSFIFTVALLISLGVPRLIFYPLAGAAFGFWGGLAASTAATMGGYLASFLFIRGRLGRAQSKDRLPPALAFLRFDPGVAGVILTRLIPVPGLLGTVALSLSPVRTRAYLIGSLIGLVPEGVPLILLGAGLLGGDPREFAWLAAGAVVLIVSAFLLIRHLLNRAKTHQDAS